MPEMSDQYVGDGNEDILAEDGFPGPAKPVPPLAQQVPFEFQTTRSYPSSTHSFVGQEHSDGSTASYYELPPDNPQELQDLISYRNMNGQMAEIFRACYRYGQVAHSPCMRDIKKILFYAQAELDRLEKYGE